MTLIEAITTLENFHQSKVTMIEFEDGSGFKFNYRIANNPRQLFGNLKPTTVEIKPTKWWESGNNLFQKYPNFFQK